MLLLIACIEVQADPDHGSQEGIMFPCMDFHPVEPVDVQNLVVNALRCGSLVINFPVLLSSARHFRVQPDVPVSFCLDHPPVFGRRAAVLTFGGMVLPIRATPYEVTT